MDFFTDIPIQFEFSEPFPQRMTHSNYLCKNGAWTAICPKGRVPCGENSCCQGFEDNEEQDIAP